MTTQVKTISFMLKPCVKCGAVDRDKKGACRPCAKDRNARWVKENPDKHNSRRAKWNKRNKDKIAEMGARYHAKNPDAARVNAHNYRSRKNAAGGRLSVGLAERLFVLQKGKCACCGKNLGDDYHLDHIMPIALGGTNTDDNIQLLRSKCNHQKTAKHPVDFMQHRGFLL